MDVLTQSVKNLYEKHPYPYAGVKDQLLEDMQLLIHYIFFEGGIQKSDYSTYSFFDAGCGAGQRVLGLARELSGATFNCVDLCEHSLKIAGEQAKKHGVKNVSFRHANLVELEEEGRYDVVTSLGVIHHTSKPEKSLQNISRLIKDDGLLIIWVYHPYGEYDRMLKRDVVMSLQGDAPVETGIKIMKELGYTLPVDQYGSHGYHENLTPEDITSKDADVFLHPIVFTYRFEDGVELFKNTDLDWMAVHSINSLKGSSLISSSLPVEPYAFDPAEYLKTEYLRERYKLLPLRDKLRIIESLIEPTAFSVVAGKQGGLSKLGQRLKNNIFWLKEEKTGK